jgi:drug/metabolite transporter (DMT)-like permease
MKRVHANLMLLLAAFLWGIGNVAQKTILQDIGVTTTVGFRCLIGLIVISPLLFRRQKEERAAPDIDGYFWGCIAVLSFATALRLQQLSFELTTVTNAGFLVNTCTVMTPLLTRFILGQSARHSVWFAVLVTFTGAGLMSGGSFAAISTGDLMALGSAFFFSIWMISVGEFVMRHGRETQLTMVQFALTGAVSLAIGLATEPISAQALINATPELFLTGVVSTGFAYLLMAAAQKYTSASEAAVIASGEAVFGAMAAYIVLGEVLSDNGVTGAMMITMGILMLQIPALVPATAQTRVAALVADFAGPLGRRKNV